MTGYLIALALILGWLAFLTLLSLTRALERFNMSFFGPFLMWRTTKGVSLLDRLAGAKVFWKRYARVCIWLTFFFMSVMFFFVVLNAVVISFYTPKPADPRLYIGLPGINPIIPVTFGIIGLVVAVIIHEFSHGILARVHGITVRSMGVLFFIFPIGAFVEPEEEEVTGAGSEVRTNIFAVGPGTNLVACFVFALIFSWGFMASLYPAADGVYINGVEKGYPAEKAGLKPGVFITMVNGTIVNNREDFVGALNRTDAGQKISVAYFDPEAKKTYVTTLTLADKGKYYERLHNLSPALVSEELLNKSYGKGFMGVSSLDLMDFRDRLSLPVRSAHSGGEALGNLVFYSLSLPLAQITPFSHPFRDAFSVKGPLAFLPPDLFWGLANTFYWLFWLNFLVGTFNTLPAVPLDGGYVLRNRLETFFLRRHPQGKDPSVREALVSKVSRAFSYGILFLLLWTLLLPYFILLVRSG